jgi:hypothetical protein
MTVTARGCGLAIAVTAPAGHNRYGFRVPAGHGRHGFWPPPSRTVRFPAFPGALARVDAARTYGHVLANIAYSLGMVP